MSCVRQTRIEQVYEALTHVPEATAKDLSRILGRKPTAISQCLGRLFWEGRVDRQRVDSHSTVEYLYRVKAPPAARQWPGTVRLAKRETERV